MAVAKSDSSSSTPNKGRKRHPAQTKKIHAASAAHALRRREVCALTDFVWLVKKEMVASDEMWRGRARNPHSDSVFGAPRVLAKRLLPQQAVKALLGENTAPASSFEGGSPLKPLARFVVYTVATSMDAKDNK